MTRFPAFHTGLSIGISCALAALVVGCSFGDSAPSAEFPVSMTTQSVPGASQVHESAAAVVDGKIITMSQVDAYVASLIEHQSLFYGDPNVLKSMEYWSPDRGVLYEAALKILIDDLLISEDAISRGIEVHDADIDALVESVADNYPSERTWKAALTAMGYTPETYRNAVQLFMTRAALREEVVEVPTPTDEQISEYAVLVAPRLEGKRSSHILFSSSDYMKALEVYAELMQGGDFSELAQTYSIDEASASNGGDLGWDSLNTYVAAYQSALDSLEVGDISPVIRSSSGYHIIMCTDEYTAPLTADGQIDTDAIPVDLLNHIITAMKESMKNERFNAYIQELESKATLVVFNEQGQQVDPATLGLAGA